MDKSAHWVGLTHDAFLSVGLEMILAGSGRLVGCPSIGRGSLSEDGRLILEELVSPTGVSTVLLGSKLRLVILHLVKLSLHFFSGCCLLAVSCLFSAEIGGTRGEVAVLPGRGVGDRLPESGGFDDSSHACVVVERSAGEDPLRAVILDLLRRDGKGRTVIILAAVALFLPL